jgi:hypothetical protein
MCLCGGQGYRELRIGVEDDVTCVKWTMGESRQHKLCGISGLLEAVKARPSTDYLDGRKGEPPSCRCIN